MIISSPGDLLLNGGRVGLGEQVQQQVEEVVGVTVGVPQLVGDRVQKQVPAWARITALRRTARWREVTKLKRGGVDACWKSGKKIE